MTKRFKKIIVIGHSDINSNYGAATSIRMHLILLSQIENYHFQLIYRRNFITKKIRENKFKNIKLEKKFFEIDSSPFAHVSSSIVPKILFEKIPNIISFLTQRKTLNRIITDDCDFIHLNSIILLPLVSIVRELIDIKQNSIKIIMHVRELVDKKAIKKYRNELNLIDKFVCIDYATKKSLIEADPEIRKEKIELISNPFIIPKESDDSLRAIFDQDSLNFAIVGGIYPDKGVEFVCKSFLDAEIKNGRLYVVGRVNNLARILQKKYPSEKIIFLGEIAEFAMRGGFLNIDCLIRGEKTFCTGRTVYESMLSGSICLLPGGGGVIKEDKNLYEFKDRVCFYEPRKSESLIEALREIKKIDISERLYWVAKVEKCVSSYIKNFERVYDI